MNTKTSTLASLSLLGALLAATATPVDAKNASCQFEATGLILAFGNLDPSNAVQKVQVVQAQNVGAGSVGDCNTVGVTMSVQIVGSSSRSMSNGAGGVIPYTLAGFPVTGITQPGNNKYVNFLSVGVAGTIAAGSYADAPAGTYSDTVTISVSP